MAKFRKQAIVIEASRWFKNGDHPEDNCQVLLGSDGIPFLSEGKIVRYFRHPDVNDQKRCEHCNFRFHDHGWIDTYEGGHQVCPGDWIITGIAGEKYPCKPKIFEATYEPARA